MQITQFLYEKALQEGLVGKHLEQRHTEIRAVLQLSGELTLKAISEIEDVPIAESRSQKPVANAICDMSQYVVGYNQSSKERAQICCEIFWAKLLNIAEAAGDEIVIKAIHSFLADTKNLLNAKKQFIALQKENSKLQSNSGWIVLYLQDDNHNLAKRPKVNKYLKSQIKDKFESSSDDYCCISGQKARPVKTHSKIKGIPNTQGSGVAAFSWNGPAYQYMEREQGDNLFISEQVSSGVKFAIEHLLKKTEDKNRSAIFLGKDRAIIWFTNHRDLSFITDVFDRFVNEETKIDKAWDEIKKLSSDELVRIFTVKGASGRWGITDCVSLSETQLSTNLLQFAECFSWMKPVNVGRAIVEAKTRNLGAPSHILGIHPVHMAHLVMAIMAGRQVPKAIQDSVTSMMSWGSKIEYANKFLSTRNSWRKFLEIREGQS